MVVFDPKNIGIVATIGWLPSIRPKVNWEDFGDGKILEIV
jgi:hypothetical protein